MAEAMQARNRPHNLPAHLTSFIGRARDLAELAKLLRTSRLVTLTGAGGIGKSRLALESASRLTPDLPDGVWLVELAAVTDPVLVPRAIATVLGVPEEVGRESIETLADFLAPRSLLLVLDNCEHLVDACAVLAEHLLHAAPGVSILATSREALGIIGETSWRVPSLSLPNLHGPLRPEPLLESEAVRLFVERAGAAASGFVVTEQNADAVAQVCGRLDGIPLAIELAAARVKLLSVEQIAARLDDRFRLLTGGSRTALPRQQTLRAAIDWSYALLTEAEQIVLRRLSVFSGGWTLEAAEAVCVGGGVEPADVLEILARLVDKSIVQVETELGDAPRYRLLETLRQYAQDRLLESGEAAAVRDRHRDWFLALSELAEPYLYLDTDDKDRDTLSQAEVQAHFSRLGQEYDNLRAALTWSQSDPGGDTLGRLAAALRQYWYHCGHFGEGREWLERALESSRAAAPPARARILLSAGFMARLQDDYPRATALFEEGMLLCRQIGDRAGLAFGLGQLGQVRRNQGDYDGALALTEEGLEVRRQTGNLRAWALEVHWYRRMEADLGAIAWYRGDLAAAERHLEDSLAQFRQLGGHARMDLDLHWLGRVAYSRGDLARARELLEQSVALGRETGFHRPISYGLQYLGLLARASGDLTTAARQLQEALALYQRAGDREGTAGVLDGLAGLALDCGEPELAARLFGAAERLRESIGAPLPPVSWVEYERDLATLRCALPAEALATAWHTGRAISIEHAAKGAMTLLPPAPGPRAVATAEPSAWPLSAREREVAALVARGLMNREIAVELVIAERTVETHVANILGKLGLKSRAQVGVWAARHGLLDDRPG